MTTEFPRFILAGGAAAVIHIGSRALLSRAFPFPIAVAIAYFIGMVTAFVLNKRFVFAPSQRQIAGEALRFTTVNLVALVQVWGVSVGLANFAFPKVGMTWHTELVAHTIGVLSPVITSYIAHKNFTFRRAD